MKPLLAILAAAVVIFFVVGPIATLVTWLVVKRIREARERRARIDRRLAAVSA